MTAAALLTAILRLAPGPTHVARARELAPVFVEVANRCGMPATLLAAVAWEESSLRPHARSPKGAIGLMGLMPATVKEMLGRKLTRGELEDPETSAAIGCVYLQTLKARHGLKGALWRYDGAKRASWGYVRDVLATWRRLEAWAGSAREVAAR